MVFCVLTVSVMVVCVNVYAASIETKQGVVGYNDTPKLPWCSYIKHDPHRPMPVYLDPGPQTELIKPPSDAIILFDGKDLSQWKKNTWKIADGKVLASKGNLETKQSFGDAQIHLEFMIPQEPNESFYNRGNSGLFLMGLYELQIFDSHKSNDKQIYPDGQCAAIYGETPPLVNACREAGQWQTYDIVFRAPVFEKGKLIKHATVTLLHNNVLVHDHTVIHAPTGHRKLRACKPHPAKLPMKLQGHGSSVSFRNIWLRPLNDTQK